MSLFPWQQQSWAQLQNYILQQRVPQALLIHGKKGYGKYQLAKQFANSLLCAKTQVDGLACGICSSCLLLATGNHPDFLFIQPEEAGKPITVDQIRSLINKVSLKPQFDKYRVVLLNPADAMNTRAVNAFLKTLEEPTERTVYLLVTDKPSTLPATIISRCQKLAITSSDLALVNIWLRDQKLDISPVDIPVLMALAQNAPLQVLEYAQQDTLKQRQACFQAWQAIANKQAHPVIVADSWQGLPEMQLWFWLSSWVIDLIRCAHHAKPENLFNPDFNNILQTLARGVELKALYGLYDVLLKCRQRLDTTINKHVLWEEILIHWSKLNRG